MSITIDHIESQALDLATARDALAATIDALQSEIDDANRRYRAQLLAELRDVQALEGALLESVSEAKALFTKPRSKVLHGIRFGWQQGKPRLEFDDDKALVERIRQQMSKARSAALIKVTEKPQREALAKLKPTELSRLQVKVINGKDEPFVRQASSDLDKVIKSLAGDLSAEGEGDE